MPLSMALRHTTSLAAQKQPNQRLRVQAKLTQSFSPSTVVEYELGELKLHLHPSFLIVICKDCKVSYIDFNWGSSSTEGPGYVDYVAIYVEKGVQSIH